nr:formin-like protein 5 [Aegilops tauschii subsp. strangulata]
MLHRGASLQPAGSPPYRRWLQLLFEASRQLLRDLPPVREPPPVLVQATTPSSPLPVCACPGRLRPPAGSYAAPPRGPGLIPASSAGCLRARPRPATPRPGGAFGRSASASHRLQPPARPRHELSLPSQAPLGPPSSFARAGLPPSTQPGPAGSAPPGFGSPRADSPPCPPAGSRGPASPCLGRLAPLAGVRLIAPPRSRVPHARAGSPRSSPAGSRHSAGPPPAGSSAPGRLPAPAHPAACRLRASLPAPPNSYDRLRR